MSRVRNWCWTVNNWDDTHVTAVTDMPNVNYTVFGKEVGESGTPHLQGYTEFSKQLRLSACKKLLPTAHWEPRAGTREQAREYCMKDGDVTEIGRWAQKRGRRTDLEDAMSEVKEGKSELELAESHPATWARNYRALERYRRLVTKKKDWKPVVKVYYGPTGVGKSRQAREEMPDAYELSSEWWDGYDGHADIIIDEFNGWIPLHMLLRILDYGSLNVPIKGGMVPFRGRRIIITSHYHPTEWYSDTSRYPELERRLDEVIHFGLDQRLGGNTGITSDPPPTLAI